jgi:Protein phosphatase 2C
LIALALQTDLVWHACASSARGASHQRSGAPNQDCGRTVLLGTRCGAILAVADGHGDPVCARSDRGSRFAVDSAIEALTDWIKSASGSEASLRSSAAGLPQRILDDWHAMVASDLEENPPTEREIAPAAPAKAELIERSTDILYGSTLVAAAVNDRLAVYIQIGDGDLLVVAADDSVSRAVPGRDDLPINQTESLCQPDAHDRFRVQVDFFSERSQPALLLLATDGYCNSFGDDQAFLKVGPDIRGYIEKRGFRWVTKQLEGWLKKTSETGSGDDITLAMAWVQPPGWTIPEDEEDGQAETERARPPWRLFAVLVIVAALVGVGWGAWLWAPAAWTDYAIELVHRIRDNALGMVGLDGASAPRPGRQ